MFKRYSKANEPPMQDTLWGQTGLGLPANLGNWFTTELHASGIGL